ncbi:MAG: transposase [Hydrococcus sp. SU_1_0]|nr:transposase [Hydrococcus sp. SU_1_0]
MTGLSKDDLAQMNRDYFQSLEKERLVEVADNLHRLAVEQWEKINSNSRNSSQPPSRDNPFQKPDSSRASNADTSKDSSGSTSSHKKNIVQEPEEKKSTAKRKPGRQKDSKGFGRSKPLSIAETILHYPSHCSACNQALVKTEPKPYMGHHVLELESTESGLKIVCQLHHYYQSTCNCGHQSKSEPGVGITSTIEGRTRDLKLTEYVEELKHLVTEAFVGWLITDGYGAYRHKERRQRCLAHLIRKAIGITESINSRTARIGTLILADLKDFIGAIREGKTEKELERIVRSLQGVCHLAKTVKHKKLKALAKEILNDWDAVVAAVNNPDLPLTNNEAERALRHAVIARRISYGTRTTEGSIALSSLLSVIETCRLRQLNPWKYISSVIQLARKGLSPPFLPSGVAT